MKHLLLSLLLMASLGLLQAQTHYVKATATGDGTGTDWDNASGDLQAVIDAAAEGDSIFVAGGTYQRTVSGQYFSMKKGVKIYGSFAGTEGSLIERNLAKGDTSILKGNNNSVIRNDGNDLDNSAVLDGFKITGGKATGNGGGGMYNSGSSPTLTNCTFSGNTASGIDFGGGGGMYNSGSSPILTNCTFSGNKITISDFDFGVGGGGGMYNSSSSPILTNCAFSGNTITSSDSGLDIFNGGGMYNSGSSPTLTNCTFSGNTTSRNGGGMDNENSSSVILTNCTFSDNTTGNINKTGGGMLNSSSSAILTNCTFSGNTASGSGGGMYNIGSSTLTNCIFWGNTTGTQGADIFTNGGALNITYSYTQTAQSGNGNITGGIDPFVNSSIPAGADGIFGTADDGLHLNYTAGYFAVGYSPIDAGINDSIPAWDTIDLAGNPRIANDTVDMGAYEFQVNPPIVIHPDTSGILYVDNAAAPGGDGSNWAMALASFSDALTAAGTINAAAISPADSVRQVWVAKGTYQPDTVGHSFSMVPKVKIYGGFAGTESSLAARNLASGDTSILLGNGNSVIRNDNNGLDTSAVLDGFKISGGYTNALGEEGYGGGIYNNEASPVFSNIIISGNTADNAGGVYNGWNSPVFKNVIISDNTTIGAGGGMYNFSCLPVLTNVRIINNTADAYGGGMYNNSTNAVFTNAILSGNRTKSDGGAISNYHSSPVLVNVRISGNMADGSGGGVANFDESSPQLRSVTVSGNKANSTGGGIYNASSTALPVMVNSIVWGNTAHTGAGIYNADNVNRVITYSLMQGLGDADINHHNPDVDPADPMFADAPDAVNAPFSEGNYQLSLFSKAVDAGKPDTAGLHLPLTDLAGNARIFGTAVDMGAYELQIWPNQLQNNGADTYNGFTGILDITGDVPALTNDSAVAFMYQWKLQAVADGTTDTTLLLIDPADYYNIAPYNTLFPVYGITLDSNHLQMNDLSVLPAIMSIIDPATAAYWSGFAGNILIERIVGTGPGTDSVISNRLLVTINTVALPVTIQHFTGMLQNGIATLQWQSGVESSFNHFELEKSIDGKLYNPIATVAAKGNNSSYTYSAPQQEASAMYRLKWTDDNGHSAYYNQIVLLTQGGAATDILVYPNPAKDYIHIRVAAAGSVSIYDAAGRLVKTQALSAGVNNMDIHRLIAGVYYAVVNGQRVQFVKH